MAVVLVVAYHAGLGVHGGFTGVDVFFVVSGYVITSVLLRELVTRDRISLRSFYRRRILRLLPALAAMVVVVAILATVASPIGSQHVGAFTGVWASFFGANAYLYLLGADYFQSAVSLDPFLHLWTLGVEEQFYIAFPALLYAAWRFGGRWVQPRRAALALLAAITTISFALSFELSRGSLLAAVHRPQQLAFYGSPTRAWEFGLGALLALSSGRAFSRPIAELLGGAGLVAILFGAFSIDTTTNFPGVEALWPALGTTAVILAGTARTPQSSRLLALRPCTWIGDRSYSWYLWHWPLIVFAKALWPGTSWVAGAAAAGSLLPAAASYRLIENPIRFSHRLPDRRILALSAVCVALPVAACCGLLGVAHLVERSATGAAWRESQSRHIDVLRGCEGSAPLSSATLATCTWPVAHPRGRIVLIGDSNASSLAEPVVAAGTQAGYDVTVATLYGCPLVDLRVTGSSSGEAACRRFDTVSTETLLRIRPNLVITAARNEDYVSGTFGLGLPGGATTYDPSEQSRLWTRGLEHELTRLNRAGIPVIVVDPVPRIFAQPSECAVLLVFRKTCGATTSRSRVDADLRPVLVAQRRAIRTAPLTTSLSLENVFCTRTRCSSVKDGKILYTDSDHLSVLGSPLVTGPIHRAIVAHARSRAR